MIYGRFRTLISLFIVLAMGGLFLYAGSRILNSLSGAGASAPLVTPTPRPAIEQPTVVPTPTPRPTAPAHVKPVASPPAKRTTPRPSPTPNTPPKVIVSSSLANTKGATTFKAGAYPQLYCLIRNSAVPTSAGSVLLTWTKDTAGGFLNQYSVPRSGGADYSMYSYYPYVAQNPGAYRCDVTANGQPFGSARFTVTP